MKPEEYEELKRLIKNTIHDEVTAIVTDKFITTLRKLDDIAEDVNSGFKDIGDDRKDMALVKTSQATVERLMKELLDMISAQTSRMAKTVEHKADQAIESSAQAVADKVEPAMQIAINKIKKGIPLNQDPWWKFWKR